MPTTTRQAPFPDQTRARDFELSELRTINVRQFPHVSSQREHATRQDQSRPLLLDMDMSNG